ncbi:ABC transporter substrate-binding protein [Paenibacillus sp. MWE-103]|uniref:ABC transporter substrate-binding protein n=1 Tax=Paenibacillus artemisiicola TaxID=1172618 RepID=A0ABS3WHB9_9BACL|nr:ABC transporter substrate-binding protein [Paenibacillus artemisiicola]MBO7747723.1 ABC transporter substrate-binding protein [Paenibacillus artemisiicola]
MRHAKKWAGLVLALILVLGLAACGGNGNNGGSGNSADAGSGGNAGGDGGNAGSGNAGSGNAGGDAGGIDTSKFETITYVVLGDKPKNGQLEKVMEKVNAILKQKVNAELQFKWVEWADWQTKYNLLLASGEPLDLITIGTDWLDTWGNAQRGAFLPLNDLLEKYAPLTYAEIPQEDWDQSKFKDDIVLIPEDHYTQWVNHGIYYRGDWAKQFGITQPITDFETLGKYFQGIKDNMKDVIPWDANGTNGTLYNGFATAYTDNIELPISTGYAGVFYGKSYDERYTVDSPIFNDKFIDFAKLMKQWGDAGYWREDVLNYKGDTRTELKAGQTGTDAHHTQTFKGLRVEMDKQQPGSELQMFSYSDTRGNLISMPITHGGTSIGAHSKHPERALTVYDLIRQDPELYKLINYGLEGVQYEIKDGIRTRPAGYDDAKDGFYTDFWGGRIDKNEIPSDTDWSGIGDIYKKYDGIKKPFPYGKFVFDKTNVDAEMTAISQVVGEQMPAILFGKAGDPEKAVQALRDKLKAAGYDKVKDEIQKQLDAFKASEQG